MLFNKIFLINEFIRGVEMAQFEAKNNTQTKNILYTSIVLAMRITIGMKKESYCIVAYNVISDAYNDENNTHSDEGVWL